MQFWNPINKYSPVWNAKPKGHANNTNTKAFTITITITITNTNTLHINVHMAVIDIATAVHYILNCSYVITMANLKWYVCCNLRYSFLLFFPFFIWLISFPRGLVCYKNTEEIALVSVYDSTKHHSKAWDSALDLWPIAVRGPSSSCSTSGSRHWQLALQLNRLSPVSGGIRSSMYQIATNFKVLKTFIYKGCIRIKSENTFKGVL